MVEIFDSLSCQTEVIVFPIIKSPFWKFDEIYQLQDSRH